MFTKKWLVFGICSLLTCASFAQTIASFKINLQHPTNGVDVPVSVNLDNLTFESDSSISLVEMDGKKRKTIPF